MSRLLIALFFLLTLSVKAQDKNVTFTQEDRDRIIRTETKLEALEKNMEARFKSVDDKFKAVDDRFQSLEKSFDDKFNILINVMLVLLASIFGMTVFIWWDRKTTLSPVEKKTQTIARELEELKSLLHSKGVI